MIDFCLIRISIIMHSSGSAKLSCVPEQRHRGGWWGEFFCSDTFFDREEAIEELGGAQYQSAVHVHARREDAGDG